MCDVAESALGDYLRSRRAQIQPEVVGLPAGARRRVLGLRREEVAMLSGVSVDYYARLEQGRERTPSTQVLDALSATSRLDRDGRMHLFRLARSSPLARPGDADESVEPGLQQLIDSWLDSPALVLTRTFDVLARNGIADALFGTSACSTNLLLNMFFDPAARSFYLDWRAAALNAVAGFRLALAEAPDDLRAATLLDDLLASSPDFTEIWARQDARGKTADTKALFHRDVGALTLRVHAFDVRSRPGQQLVVYHAESDSPSAHALTLLGMIAANRP